MNKILAFLPIIIPIICAQTIASSLQNDTQFSTLNTLINGTNILNNGSITLFAPTNNAFVSLQSQLGFNLNSTLIGKLLLYHVVPVVFTVSNISSICPLPTLEGETISGINNGAALILNNRSIVMTQLVFSNGVIMVIDEVLIPPSLIPILPTSGQSTNMSTQSTSTGTQSTSTGAQSTSSDTQSESTSAQSTSSDTQSASTSAESTSAGAQSTSVSAESTSASAESTSVSAESTSAGAQSTSASAESTSGSAQSTIANTQSTNVNIQSSQSSVSQGTSSMPSEPPTPTFNGIQCTDQSCCTSRQIPNPKTGEGYLEFRSRCLIGGIHCVQNSGCQLCHSPSVPKDNVFGRPLCNSSITFPLPQCSNQQCCTDRMVPNPQTGYGYLQFNSSCLTGSFGCQDSSGCLECFNSQSGAQNFRGIFPCSAGAMSSFQGTQQQARNIFIKEGHQSIDSSATTLGLLFGTVTTLYVIITHAI